MAAIFAHSSSGPPPLRTLTLGVLIVSGGTLAALPFRRYQAIPDSSVTPVQATGPTVSDLKMGLINPAVDTSFAPPQVADATIPGSILATHSQQADSVESAVEHLNQMTRMSAARNVERSPDTPLTYEDLVLPIETPDIVQQRFNATAAVKSIQTGRHRLSDSTPPRMEPMTADSPEEINSSHLAVHAQKDEPKENRSVLHRDESQDELLQSNGTTMPDQNRRAKESSALAAAGPESEEGAAGSLASATAAVDVIIREKTPERLGQLPEAVKNNLLTPVGSPSRTRHWIRQPD